MSAIGMGISLLGCGPERSGKKLSVRSSGGSAPALQTYKQSGVLDEIRYVRPDLHDGYIVGNGRMYAVAGLGKTMARVGKSQLTPEKAPLSKLSWIIGPTYTIGNLGYGWQVEAAVDGQQVNWQKEAVMEPTRESPFWGVRSEHSELTCVLHDVIAPDSAAMVRCIRIQRPDSLSPTHVNITLPVYPDPRNGVFTMFDGRPVDAEVSCPSQWTLAVMSPASPAPAASASNSTPSIALIATSSALSLSARCRRLSVPGETLEPTSRQASLEQR